MVKVLITGGAGFIGSHLSKNFIEKGHDVAIVDMLHPYYSINRKKQQLAHVRQAGSFRFYEVNLLDEVKTKEIFEVEQPEVVIHLAAIPGVMQSLEKPLEYVDYDVKATINTLKAAGEVGVKRFMFASSSSVYGDHHEKAMKEEMANGKVISPYAAAKYSAEAFCHAYQSIFGYSLTILRFFTVYGPWGRPDMAIGNFIQSAIHHEPITIYGQHTARDYTYIDDIVRGIEAAMWHNHQNETFNLGSSAPVTIEQLTTIIQKHFPHLKIEREVSRIGDVRNTWADLTKAQQLLSYNPSVTIEDGIARTVEWAKGYEAP
ncbi:NAD-dependent epimerase/dehydratase family protein [Metabacillus iocasae]|uniref:UDP-glucuronate 4-epimerase n=1 Tax=Priestia iocasae TaxID=2291674 RepID=A0ABS2QP94_9BACI|nr:NAD-dependent epimerase/dehydratase family protein [Metabacillus iocasae]MBM7701279.1 UDP-glucuronate 4-epimerase [Metabacillus iocasae]